jgi:macrodomain Ter protein organizer (MatP/YcbG family)
VVSTDIKVERAGIRFKNLDPEYAPNAKLTPLRFHIGRIEHTKVLSIRVPPETYNRLSLYAKNQKLSVSEVVRRAIEEYLNRS